MAEIKKLESRTFEFELKCSADKFYEVYRDHVIIFPKLFPENYKSVEVLEGNGKSVGTVTLWKYVQGGSPNVLVAKVILKAVDEENRSITFRVLEGDLMKDYDKFDIKLSVTPKGSDDVNQGSNCLVKWCVEYEKKTQDVPSPNAIIDLIEKITKELELHLLKA